MTLPDEQAVINIEQGRSVVDYARLVANWLRDSGAGGEWQSSFTDSIAPRVSLYEESQAIDFQMDDQIRVYVHSERAKPVTAPYLWRNRTVTVSAELRTGKGRTHLYKMLAEVERIVSVHRTDTFGLPGDTNLTGRSWAADFHTSKPDQAEFGIWSMVVDVDLHWDFSAVYTQ